jgi:uncharacterized protein YdhG (YjbR/CyaY superfamily)
MSVFDEYFSTVSDSDRAEFERLREFVRQAVPDVEEALSYGMPAFKYKGRPLIGLRAGKNHLSVFPFSPAAVDSARKELAGFDLSKGTVRFTSEAPIPDSALEKLLRQRMYEIDSA